MAEKIKFLDTKKDGQATETQSDTQVPQNEFENMSFKTEVQQQFEYTDDDLPF